MGIVSELKCHQDVRGSRLAGDAEVAEIITGGTAIKIVTVEEAVEVTGSLKPFSMLIDIIIC